MAIDQEQYIYKRNMAECSSMLRQTERERAGTMISSSQCERNNRIRTLNRATSLISALSDELVIEILSRLPPKPFFHCRTVCKSWFSLSSEAFGRNKHLQPTVSGIFYNKLGFGAGFVKLSRSVDKVEVDRTIGALSSYDILRIIDCCNGLLLVEAMYVNISTVHDLFVYNPVTRTLLTVSPPVDHNRINRTFSLSFDPQVYSQFHIFCFPILSDIGGIFSFDIFSFERGKCISQKKMVCDMTIRIYSKRAFVEGRVHHVTTDNKILSIDPNKCSYQVIHPPYMENRTYVQVEQSQGLLHILSLCDKEGLLFIWVLKSYTEQKWMLKHQLSLHQIYSGLRSHCDVSRILARMQFLGQLAFHPEKDILFMPVGCDYFMMSLDLSTGKTMELGTLGDRVEFVCWVYMPCYLV